MSGRGGGFGHRGGRGNGRGSHGGGGVCFTFQNTGACNRPNCHYSHEARTQGVTHGVCYTYQKTGSCEKVNCRYSHNLNGQQPKHAVQTRVNESTEQKEARQSYNAWKPYLGQDPDNSRTMRRLWKGALAILEEGDRDWKQQLPQDLSTDTNNHKGYKHISAIMNKRVPNRDYEEFIEICHNFLNTMTHPAMLDCLSVDTYVGSLFNYMSGANGSRAIPFFQHLCEILVAVRTDSKPLISPATMESTLVAMSVTLSELLKRNSSARFHDDLQTLIDALEAAAQIFAPGTPSVTGTMVLNNAAGIRAIVARANGLLIPQEMTSVSSEPVATSSYPRDLVIPNDRHDNDKLDIADVTIFPTLDEIMSDAKEFLPFTDPDQPHFLTNAVERHIDTYFRLLRHEVFGNLKNSLSGFMQTMARTPNMLNNQKLNLGDVRAYYYTGAFVSGVSFGAKSGLKTHLSFQQPSQAPKKTGEKRKWWEESRRLERGSLLSFIWLQNATVQHVFLEVTNKATGAEKAHSLVGADGLATTTVRLMTQNKSSLELLMRASTRPSHGAILEYPKLMPATFVPILENLQSMQRLGRFPFSQWIVPGRHNGPSRAKLFHNIPPPLYARKPGFGFSLESIMADTNDSLVIEPTAQCDDESLLDKVEARTPLDRGQCRALVAALTREYAFIQGPPGTGKSWVGLKIMRVLLDIKKKSTLGPILVVCYTNHALDQFLEHLLDIGVQKIIRVGGQSKSPRLQDHNLNHLKRGETKTRSENYQVHMAYKGLEKDEDEAQHILNDLGKLTKRGAWKDFAAHLREDYRRIHSQFQNVDEDGFESVGRHPFEIWRSSSALRNPATRAGHHVQPLAPVDLIIQKATTNVHSLSFPERQALVSHWIEEIHSTKVGQLFETVNGATARQIDLKNIHAESDRRILQDPDVIGITTSGLAGKISILRHIKSKVMICEEAGEILEPHMISALLPSVEHCIQIGDHEQLRPSVTNFEDLSLESQRGKLHQLDKSQFERLSVGEPGRPLVPVAQLNVQRRMRPEISMLIRNTIYDKLVDHASTMNTPDVVGLRKNVFWLNHDNVEDGQATDSYMDKSKTNAWEVVMIQALVRHVIRQGVYKSSDIAVLTPYTGQLQKIRQAMRRDFEIVLSDRDQEALENEGFESGEDQPKVDEEDVQDHRRRPLLKKTLVELLRVATVDNFQGEEAKVVIVSLVRSNKQGKVGFLKSSNRINVLLSRAKHGMYLIGNTDTYSRVQMWQEVIDMLRANDSVGDEIGLCCPRHPDTVMNARQPDNFAILSPEGGCNEACSDRLDCGHSCQARCHSEAMHSVFPCGQPCQRRHKPCDHPCQKQTCGEDCGKCMIELNDVQLPCGHTKHGVLCHLALNLESIKCDVQVVKQVPDCTHSVTVKCSQLVTRESGFKCPTSCGIPLPCGHPCSGTCGLCNIKDPDGAPIVKHVVCAKPCGRKFGTCNHNCSRPCHSGTDCGLCHNPCEVRCKHTKCPLKCHEPCAPCIQPCVWSCEHQGDCTMPCSAPCNRLPCNERCTKLLPCGHQCPSICGEQCPVDYCQECGMKADGEPDMILFQSYSEIDLNETPIIVLGCPHFFTTETLDGQVELKEVYTHDPVTGRFTGLVENSELAVKVPQCPHCQRPIRQHVTQRYNRLVNRAVMDEMSKRFIVSGQHEIQELETNLRTLEQDLEVSRQSLIPDDTLPPETTPGFENMINRLMQKISSKIKNRYSRASGLELAIKSCQSRMADRHQPATKLHNATRHSITKNASIDDALANLSLESSAASAKRNRDQRITYSISLLELKIRCTILEDKYEMLIALRSKLPSITSLPKLPGGNPVKLSDTFLNDCTKLIRTCISQSLPKLAVEAILYFSRIARLLNVSDLCPNEHRKTAKEYKSAAEKCLERAAQLCTQPFQGAKELAHAVEHASRLLGKEFYEEVSKEEIDAIKQAMVSGRGGIATHSGHWYDCENGHPFAVGECGMPMQIARCPECGARVGGQNHTAVAGVRRAERME